MQHLCRSHQPDYLAWPVLFLKKLSWWSSSSCKEMPASADGAITRDDAGIHASAWKESFPHLLLNCSRGGRVCVPSLGNLVLWWPTAGAPGWGLGESRCCHDLQLLASAPLNHFKQKSSHSLNEMKFWNAYKNSYHLAPYTKHSGTECIAHTPQRFHSMQYTAQHTQCSGPYYIA